MNINQATIGGHLGDAPVIRYTADDDPVASFSVATTAKWKDKSGELKEKTEWHKVSAFGKSAEVASKYLKKGSPVVVFGTLRTTSFEKDGQTHYRTGIVVERLHLLGRKEEGEDAEHVRDEAVGGEGSGGPPDDDIPF